MAKTPIKHLDKRLAPRYLERGELDKKVYDKHISDLPDLADQADNIAELVYASSDDDGDIPATDVH